ncbi:MAG: presqualene diphosphate synthase HpnD [Solirubrobacteraceae bacterium]
MSAATQHSSPTAQAYRSCEQITRRCAANFYYGIRLLPPGKRNAMCAVYAFARRIDDIGDGSIEPERKLALLDDAERALGGLADENGRAGERGDQVLVALADAHARSALPLDALLDLIEGVRMDVRGVTYETFEELVPYCRRVAGSIGRLCVAIFGARESERACVLADDLGVALQLTNILRDVREDADNGRLYVPRQDLVRYRLSTDGRFQGEEGQFEAFMRFQAARAREWFERGEQLVPLLDRRSAACVLAMSGIYRRLLDRIEQRPERVAHERISLPIWEKGWVATRSLLGAAL